MSPTTGDGHASTLPDAAATAASNAKPIYLIPGGHPPDGKQTLAAISAVYRACAVAAPTVAYIGTANHDSKMFFQMMKTQLLKAGAAIVTLAPIAGKRANRETARKIIEAADCVFLSGGEVEDGIRLLHAAGLDDFLREQYQSGKLFFGVSAGCIMMGQYWVHWDVEDDDSTASLFDCLNFVPLTFDTHCEDEDWKELRCALRLLGPGAAGYGLSTNGFYSAISSGKLTSYRNDPAVLRNVDGYIQAVKWDA